MIIHNFRQKTYASFIFSALCVSSYLPSQADDLVTRGDFTHVRRRQIAVPAAGALDQVQSGLSKFDKGNFNGALIDLNQAILKDPLNPQAYLYRGLVRENMGDFINAMSDFDQNRIAALQPVVLSEKGYCLTRVSDFKSAMNNFDKSLDMDNTSNDASLTYVRRSMVKRVTKDPQGAVDDCTHALSINKDNIEANWQRSLAYCAMHKVDNAVPDLQQVIHTNPNFADAHFMLAECYSVLGRAREALPEYQRAANLYAAQHDEDGKKLAMKRIAELSAHS